MRASISRSIRIAEQRHQDHRVRAGLPDSICGHLLRLRGAIRRRPDTSAPRRRADARRAEQCVRASWGFSTGRTTLILPSTAGSTASAGDDDRLRGDARREDRLHHERQSSRRETNGTQVVAPDAGTAPSVTMTIHPGAVPPEATGVNIASIGGVTTLRAAGFQAGYAPTNIDTQTYSLPGAGARPDGGERHRQGLAAAAVNGQVFNYGMDPNVVSTRSRRPRCSTSLAIASRRSRWSPICKNLVNPATGIYVNADQHGAAWERPISTRTDPSARLCDPDGNPEGFQIDAGLAHSRRVQPERPVSSSTGSGCSSRTITTESCNHRMFGNEGTDEFGKLDLGTSSNYAWFRESSYGSGRFNTMCRDMFCRDTQGALGQPYTKSRFYHLYLNGHLLGDLLHRGARRGGIRRELHGRRRLGIRCGEMRQPHRQLRHRGDRRHARRVAARSGQDAVDRHRRGPDAMRSTSRSRAATPTAPATPRCRCCSMSTTSSTRCS